MQREVWDLGYLTSQFEGTATGLAMPESISTCRATAEHVLILSKPEREPQVVPADATSRKPVIFLSSSSSEIKNIIMPGPHSDAYLGGLRWSRGASVVEAVYLGAYQGHGERPSP